MHFAFSAARGGLEHTVERLHRAGADARGPVEHSGGDRSVYVEDPEGNVVEVWDYFEDGDGEREGVAGLADGHTTHGDLTNARRLPCVEQ